MSANCVWHSKYTAVSCSRNPLTLWTSGKLNRLMPGLMPLPALRRMAIMAKHYPVEQRERAVKMVLDHLDEYWSVYAACQAIH